MAAVHYRLGHRALNWGCLFQRRNCAQLVGNAAHAEASSFLPNASSEPKGLPRGWQVLTSAPRRRRGLSLSAFAGLCTRCVQRPRVQSNRPRTSNAFWSWHTAGAKALNHLKCGWVCMPSPCQQSYPRYAIANTKRTTAPRCFAAWVHNQNGLTAGSLPLPIPFLDRPWGSP